MKKVLIVANLFHASPRIPGLVSYLPEFGWEAAIITPPPGEDFQRQFAPPKKFFENVKIIEAPYRGDIFWFWRKIFKLFRFDEKRSIPEQLKEKIGMRSKKSLIDIIMRIYQEIFAYPDTEKTWQKPALNAAEKILKKEHFNVVLSSSPFPTAHIIAAKLKKEFFLPWLADFRDLWTQNHNYPYPWWRKIFEKQLELKTLTLADALITVSSPYRKKLGFFHKNKKIYIISNGFDPEKVNNPPVNLTPKFTITYTGQIYTGKQDPLKLLIVLKSLISEKNIDKNEVEVRFYGRVENWFRKEIEDYELTSIVKQYGIVPREIALRKQWESQILLLLNWEDSDEKGCYTGKVFEYLAAQRPILATGGFGSDVVEQLIKETNTGTYCPKVEDIKKYLRDAYLEYKRNNEVSFNGNIKQIQKYSYREMAKKFANILNQIT